MQVFECNDMEELRSAWRSAAAHVGARAGEELWYRGSRSRSLTLTPSLFWKFADLSDEELDRLERNLFFEFQARARELHERGLSDWDYLFFMRHHGVPTRILDWSDAFGIALHFALETPPAPGECPCVWILNPYALNEATWEWRDLVQPKYVGYVQSEDDFWDYGELLESPEDWEHDGAVAIYPLQISERMRAQRGWFTLAGNSREPIEKTHPDVLARIDLASEAVESATEFLAMAGIRPYSVYPDLDRLGVEILQNNAPRLSRPRDESPSKSSKRRAR